MPTMPRLSNPSESRITLSNKTKVQTPVLPIPHRTPQDITPPTGSLLLRGKTRTMSGNRVTKKNKGQGHSKSNSVSKTASKLTMTPQQQAMLAMQQGMGMNMMGQFDASAFARAMKQTSSRIGSSPPPRNQRPPVESDEEQEDDEEDGAEETSGNGGEELKYYCLDVSTP